MLAVIVTIMTITAGLYVVLTIMVTITGGICAVFAFIVTITERYICNASRY